MVVPVNTPGSGDGDKLVCSTVAVAVPHLRDIGALGEGEPAILMGHSERLVQSTGKFAPSHLAKVLSEGAIADPNVAAAGCQCDALVIDDCNGGSLHDLSFWQRNLLAQIKVLHGGSCSGKGCRSEHGRDAGAGGAEPE